MARPHQQLCPVAASLNQLGDMWTLLIVREALNGATRFGEFQHNTGIAKTLLAERLTQMVEDGLLLRHDIGQRGVRYEYRLTKKGRSLVPVLVAISQWGNAWIFGEGREPMTLIHRETRDPLAPLRPASSAGQTFDWRDVQMVPGPGADAALKARFTATRKRKD
ncbi:MAG: helix-turn-helix transcriptional regulator [Sphingomonadales bacterium]|nr:helix-turn-helix transcriptional regulator [Sphingomonadales bacterium]